MKMNITKENQDLLLGKNIANVATINPDGFPRLLLCGLITI